MAKTVVLHAGGRPHIRFPAHDASRQQSTQFMFGIAGEYERGSFTLGNILQPASMPFQRDALKHVKTGDTPVFVSLVTVPELHSVTQLFVHVDPFAAVAGQTCCTARNDTMNGVTFDVVAKLVDTTNAAGHETLEALIEAGEDFALPAGFTDIVASTVSARQAFLDTAGTKTTTAKLVAVDPLVPNNTSTIDVTTVGSPVFVPMGKALVIGVSLKTPPTADDTTFATMQGRVAVVVKADSFDYPVHM